MTSRSSAVLAFSGVVRGSVLGICCLIAVSICPSASEASNRMSCKPTKPQGHSVGSGGYSFRSHSNLAQTTDGSQCLQWIVRNEPKRPPVRVHWYHPQPSEKITLLGSTIVAGCFDASECVCDKTDCQFVVESYPVDSAPPLEETTIEFGIAENSNKWFTDSKVPGRPRPKLTTPQVTPKLRPRQKPAKAENFLRRASNVFTLPDSWKHQPLSTHIGGFSSTIEGVAISLDLTFVSSAQKEADRQYYVSYHVQGSAGANPVFLASESGIRSGKLKLASDAIAVAWTAVESLAEPALFEEQLSMFRLQELANRAQQPRKATGVGISDDTRVLVYYAGEILIDMPLRAYIATAFD